MSKQGGNMDIKQAMQIVEVATGSYKGTREEHQRIIEAISMIKKEVEKEESKDGKED